MKKTKEPARQTALTIRGLSPAVRDHLRANAKAHGCSIEEAARDILQEALTIKRVSIAKKSTTRVTKSKPVADEPELNLAEAIHRLFAPLGGVELPPHPPVIIEDPIRFD